MPSTTRDRQATSRRVLDVAILVGGIAAATVLVAKGVHDARGGGDWPRWLELVYVSAVLAAGIAAVVFVLARRRLAAASAVLDDERSRAVDVQATALALGGALAVQVPFFFRVSVPSVAQAQFTVAAALLVYGAARLWLNRDVG